MPNYQEVQSFLGVLVSNCSQGAPGVLMVVEESPPIVLCLLPPAREMGSPTEGELSDLSEVISLHRGSRSLLS